MKGLEISLADNVKQNPMVIYKCLKDNQGSGAPQPPQTESVHRAREMCERTGELAENKPDVAWNGASQL